MNFFFSSRRRHTRCGRDWSSDVCSSDLGNGFAHDLFPMGHNGGFLKLPFNPVSFQQEIDRFLQTMFIPLLHLFLRSEERRVGKECCSRWSSYAYSKNMYFNLLSLLCLL